MNNTVNSSLRAVKEKIIDSLDFSIMGLTHNFARLHTAGFKSLSLHVKWSDLTGTLDGSVQLQQSNDPAYGWVDVPTISKSLDSADGDVYFDVTSFTGDALNIVVTKGNITGGTLEAVLVLKS